MRLVGLALAAAAAFWYAKRRRQGTAAVVGAPATPRPVSTPGVVPGGSAKAGPRPDTSDGTEAATRTGLDASAGWDDSTNEPTRRGATHPDPTAPGLSGDDIHGVAAWDRPS
ncbi:hypothetical protein ACHAAC_17305 [Aeromicrobium sp. CF4.19]|uniref:hypothetical protein n=1 Tax=Aeromicrobium sp. CF4.19 TaxID=3373082 RepID=UPI003EE6383B